MKKYIMFTAGISLLSIDTMREKEVNLILVSLQNVNKKPSTNKKWNFFSLGNSQLNTSQQTNVLEVS